MTQTKCLINYLWKGFASLCFWLFILLSSLTFSSYILEPVFARMKEAVTWQHPWEVFYTHKKLFRWKNIKTNLKHLLFHELIIGARSARRRGPLISSFLKWMTIFHVFTEINLLSLLLSKPCERFYFLNYFKEQIVLHQNKNIHGMCKIIRLSFSITLPRFTIIISTDLCKVSEQLPAGV